MRLVVGPGLTSISPARRRRSTEVKNENFVGRGLRGEREGIRKRAEGIESRE